MMPITSGMVRIEGGRMVARTISRRSDGMVSTRSTSHMRAASTSPPKYPATSPTAVPISRLIAMARAPTKSEVRAPYASRAHTSRPSVSVPSGCAPPGPSGPRYVVTTIASGSYAVSHGAASATSPSVPTSTTPAAKSRRLRRREPSPVSAASGTLYPRVDHAVEQVDDQVRDQHQHRREEDRAGHERDVEIEHRL